MIRLRLASPVVLLWLLSLSPSDAYADALPPEETACAGKAAGSECDDPAIGRSGACIETTCTRPDYAHWDRDASASPPLVSHACTICDTAGAGSDGGITGTDAGGHGDPASKSGGCSVIHGEATLARGAWVIALIALAIERTRRMRRR